MSALDEFLNLCDADPDFDSGDSDNDDPFERISKAPAEDRGKTEELAATNDKEFQQLFGAPVQIGAKQKNGNGGSGNKNLSQTTMPKNSNRSNGFAGFTPKLEDSVLVNDPYSRLRLFKNSIQLYFDEVQTLELSLKERNLAVPHTPLDRVALIKDKGQFWTCAVVVKKLSGIRQSAKGNDYGIWEISDLDSANSMTLFLFGASASADPLKIISVGSLIDVVNPAIMPDKQNGAAAAGVKLSVSLASQIRHIGTARDFGFCGSRRKDGKECMNPVNKFKCEVCIHHASSELRKLNSGKKSSKWAKKTFTDYEKMQFAARMESARIGADAGVITSNFGKSGEKSAKSGSNACPRTNTKSAAKPTPLPDKYKLKPVRMELQGPADSLYKKSAAFKDSTITYSKESSHLLLTLPGDDTVKRPKKALNLNPLQTKHLSERDKYLLEKLDKSKPNSDLPAMLTDPNPGSQNFLKYLNNVQKAEQNDDGSSTGGKPPAAPGGPLIMTRETLMNMQKAISVVKKSGPIEKSDPNAVPKRRKLSLDAELNTPNKYGEIGGKILGNKSNRLSLAKVVTDSDGNPDINSDEFQRILNAKSAHSDIAEGNQEADYFNKLERKEAIENKLLSTFSLTTTAFMCRECKYVALSQSDLCKERNHAIRAVKAVKRFFKCKECGNRTMSLDRLPKRPCTQCKSSSWLAAPVGKERAGPTLDSERLSLRGDEEKFLGSTSSKLFL